MIPDPPPPLVWPHAWRPTPPAILINPDCRDGKHGSCSGGWNETTDMPDNCPCTCHAPETETP